MGVNGIYGLSGSGLDVESMVKVGMLSKQSEYDKMQQKYTKNEWKKTEYLNVYNEVQTFNASTLSKYKMSSNMNARSAASANSNVVTATANANAATMTHYVEVGALASSAYLIGQTLTPLNSDSEYKNQLSSLLFSSVSDNNDITTLTKSDGNTITIDNQNKKTDSNSNYNASDVAFAFSINDGVNGLLATDNSDVVVASATPDAETGTYKVVINSIAQTVSSTGSNRASSRDTDLSYVLNNSKISDAVASYTSQTDHAITFNFGDGTKEAGISLTYADLNGKVGDLLDTINEQFKENELTLEASIDTSGGISIKNTTVDSDITLYVSDVDDTLSILRSDNNDSLIEYLTSSLFANGKFNSYNFTTSKTIATGQNAVGTIVKLDDEGNPIGETKALNFEVNEATSSDYNITVTAKKPTTGMEISNNGSQNVSVTYGELLNGFTFNDLTSKINSMGLNVRANYDSVQNRFTFYNKNSGVANNITIKLGTGDSSEAAANFFNSLGLRRSENGAISDDVLTFTQGKDTVQTGKDSTAKIDGVEYTLDSNTISVDGVTYNLSNVTEGQKVSVTVTQDAESIVKNVQSFVDEYNALLKKLYEWYDEKPNSDYKPLTASQKEAMKDEQIEKWEEKAKAGMLYHDSTLRDVISEIRSAVSENVDGVNGKYKNIFSIGISTTGLKGQLTIDTDKLRAAIADDPDAVYNVFAKLDGGEKQYKLEKVDANGDGTGEYIWSANRYEDGYQVVQEDGKDVTKTVERSSYNGIAQRLGDVFMASMKSIKSVSGTTASISDDSELNNLLRDLQTKMSNFKKMMQAFETKLYKKYDAMESSLALLGSQLNYVTSAFQ